MQQPDDTRPPPRRHVLLADGGPMPEALRRMGAVAVARGPVDVAVIEGPATALAARLAAGPDAQRGLAAWRAQARAQRAALEAAGRDTLVFAREMLDRDPVAVLAPLRARWGDDPPAGWRTRSVPPPPPPALVGLVLGGDPEGLALAGWLSARCGLPVPVTGPEAGRAALAAWSALAEAADRGRMETALAQTRSRAEARARRRADGCAGAREAVLARVLLEDAAERPGAGAHPRGETSGAAPRWRWPGLRRGARGEPG